MDNPFDSRGPVDSRDVVRYFQDRESDLAVLKEDLEKWENEGGDGRPDDEEMADLEQEVEDLKAFIDECESNSCDWSYGETLIPEDEFVEYVQQLCEDIGDVPRDIPDYLVIDWEATADNIKADYAEVEYKGEVYLIRCA